MEIKTRFGNALVVPGNYAHGGAKSVELRDALDGMPIAKLTVNIPEANPLLKEGEILVKTWSENEGVAEDCLKSGLWEDTGKRVAAGYCQAQIWREVNLDG